MEVAAQGQSNRVDEKQLQDRQTTCNWREGTPVELNQYK
jgi:hypothetical protein